MKAIKSNSMTATPAIKPPIVPGESPGLRFGNVGLCVVASVVSGRVVAGASVVLVLLVLLVASDPTAMVESHISSHVMW